MGIFKKVVHAKIDAFVKKLEKATILGINNLNNKTLIPSIWVTKITYSTHYT